MGKENHDIELFRRLIAPRHTAFNARAFSNTFYRKHNRKPKSEKKKPLPEGWGYARPLNVLLRNRIGVSRCRAPPYQGFPKETGQNLNFVGGWILWVFQVYSLQG